MEMLNLYHYHLTLWEMGGSRAEMALERETLVLNTARRLLLTALPKPENDREAIKAATTQ